MENKLIYSGTVPIGETVSVPNELGVWYKVQPGDENSPIIFRHLWDYDNSTHVVEKYGTSWLRVDITATGKTTVSIANNQGRNQSIKVYRL